MKSALKNHSLTILVLILVGTLLSLNYIGLLPQHNLWGTMPKINHGLRQVCLKPSVEKELHFITKNLLTRNGKRHRNYKVDIYNLAQEINKRKTWDNPASHVLGMRYCLLLEELNRGKFSYIPEKKKMGKVLSQREIQEARTLHDELNWGEFSTDFGYLHVVKKMPRKTLNTWGNIRAVSEERAKNEFSALMMTIN